MIECRNHAGRAAVGRCRSCNAAVCEPCVTRVRGRFTCSSCASAPAQPAEDSGGSLVLDLILATMSAGGVFVILWIVGLWWLAVR